MRENERHRRDRERGEEYQDFLTQYMIRNHGIPLNLYSSKKYQFEYGEGASGIEVKFDAMSEKYGNWYIETEHKTSPEQPDWRPGGVMRNDNAWLYLIGNSEQAMLMSKRQLRLVIQHKSDEYKLTHGIKFKEIATSRGYAFPISYCKGFLCLKHFVFDKRFVFSGDNQ